MVRRLISDEDIDDDWKIPVAEKYDLGLKFSHTALLEAAIVKFTYVRPGNSASRSSNGFFIKLPGSEFDVALTAGHNLIDENKQRSEQMSLSYIDPKSRERLHFDIAANNMHICEAYEKNPGPDQGENDYGVVMLPKDPSGESRYAFGFSLILGHAKVMEGDVQVMGYQAGDDEGPVNSSGECVNPILAKNRLEYRVKTEAGISGSPVWIGYNGSPTVVAVHNYGPNRPGGPSKGSRINLKLLHDLCRWANIGVTSKRLRIQSQYAPPLGLYLAMSEEEKVFKTVVQGGDDPELEKFDAIPAYSDGTERHESLYIFSSKGRWVSWNLYNKTATLVDEPGSTCLANIAEGHVEQGNSFRIVFKRTKDMTVAVVKTQMMKRWQLEEAGEMFSGLAFNDYYEGEEDDEVSDISSIPYDFTDRFVRA